MPSLLLGPRARDLPHRVSVILALALSAAAVAGLTAAAFGASTAQRPAVVALAIIVLAASLHSLRRRFNEVSELDHAREEARRDHLTGLGNRRALVERLTHAEAHEERPALILLDLDGFKDVNDAMGHHGGDTVLSDLAERLRALEDRYSANMYRLGGDEFAFVLGGDDRGAADRLAAAVTSVVEQPFVLGDRTFLLGSSIGIADAASGVAVEHLLDVADAAMYEAKRRHQSINRLDVAGSDEDRLGLATSARLVDLVDDIDIRCQPIIDAATDAIVGVEALARYLGKNRPSVPVGEFVAAVHRVGRLCELTDVMLAKTLDWARIWFDAGTPLSVSVNVSLGDLLDDRFEARVLSALESRRLPPHLLTLELAMSSIDGHLTVGADALQRLRKDGVRMSLDDFGTGHANLARFTELEFDELKLDRRFSAGAVGSAHHRAAIGAAVTLAHEVGAVVVAEGVEDADTCALVRELGVDLLQGYYLGVPVRPADLSLPTPNLGPDRRTRSVGWHRTATIDLTAADQRPSAEKCM